MDFSQRRRVEARTDQTFGYQPAGHRRIAGTQSRKARHTGILQAVPRLDARLDPTEREELARWIRTEYETEFGDIPLGFLAQCHLGPPYVDHCLDLMQSIVEHYAPADVVPEPFAGARMLARTGAYVFIEVYASGELCPVRADGSAVV